MKEPSSTHLHGNRIELAGPQFSVPDGPNVDAFMIQCIIVKPSCCVCVSQAETTQAGLRPEQQAKHQVVLQPYMTFNSRQQNYIYISSGSNTVSVGETLILRLHIAAAEPAYKDAIKQITYLVRRHITSHSNTEHLESFVRKLLLSRSGDQ